MKKITNKEFISRIINFDYNPLSEYTGAFGKVLLECKSCGTQWKATGSKAIRNVTGCPTCRLKKISETLKSKNPNKIISDHGDWLEIDVSTPKYKDAVMCIDKNDWHNILELGYGRTIADKHRYTLYARIWIGNNKRAKIHRLILPNSAMVDHKDGNGLNNRRSNLRPCTNSQNTRNHRIKKNCKTGVTGVRESQTKGKWKAYISIEKKQTSLGTFDSFDSAVTARKEAEQKYYGEFAKK